jgi:hypothetical protein
MQSQACAGRAQGVEPAQDLVGSFVPVRRAGGAKPYQSYGRRSAPSLSRQRAYASGVWRLVSGLGLVGLLHRRLGFLSGQQRRRLETGKPA